MKITYAQNPLYTTIELDEHEKKELWYKVKIEEMVNLLFVAHFYLKEKYYNLERVKKAVEPGYYLDEKHGKKCGLDERVDMIVNELVQELMLPHCGDCTCVPCSCMKCYAENLLGIDTTKGLGKYMANKINDAFEQSNEKVSLDEAIRRLENYEPKAEWEGWEPYAPRWKAEAAQALEWLKNYRDTHFKESNMS